MMEAASENQWPVEKKHTSRFLLSGVTCDILGLIQHFLYNPHFLRGEFAFMGGTHNKYY